MKKKALSIFLITALMIFSINITAIGSDEIPVFYNGVRVIFDVNPIVSAGRTMVPMRVIFETFGASVEYNSQTKQITAIKGSLVIILNLGNTYATVTRNGVLYEYTLDAAPLAIDGRTVVPLRFIGESLGATVNWNGTTKTVTIIEGSSNHGNTNNGNVLSATEIAKLMAPRSVILYCLDSSENIVGSGSGFFINSNGHIVTNYHVIDNVQKLMAITNDGNSYEVQNVIYTDKDRDLAVISINITGVSYVTLGDSSTIETGNTIYTYGSPRGISNTIADGIISNTNVVYDNYSFIQITAPISPGSSGGSLIDEYGNVIGITTLTRTDAQNMNYAIPVNDLKQLLKQTPLNKPFSSWQTILVFQRIDYSNGYYYGYTLRGIRHGYGTYVWYSGDIYVGDWKNGVQDGFGTYTWSDGENYVGEWKNGDYNGFGIYTYADGTVKRGQWENGIFIGDTSPIVTPSADIVSTTQIAKNKIEIKFSTAVDTALTVIRLKQGVLIYYATVAWNVTKDVATLTTTVNPIPAGVFVVEVTISDKVMSMNVTITSP
jgi:hypothetical protein